MLKCACMASNNYRLSWCIEIYCFVRAAVHFSYMPWRFLDYTNIRVAKATKWEGKTSEPNMKSMGQEFQFFGKFSNRSTPFWLILIPHVVTILLRIFLSNFFSNILCLTNAKTRPKIYSLNSIFKKDTNFWLILFAYIKRCVCVCV